MLQRTIQVLGCTVSLLSNNADLISQSEYFEDVVPQSLLNMYCTIASVQENKGSDAYMYIIDHSHLPTQVTASGHMVIAQGDFTSLEQNCHDRRFALLGTQGLLYRHILATLERSRGIFSFHANALYNEQKHELLIALGSSGAGKTPLLLASISRGYKVFGTDHIHFQVVGNQIVFHKGGLLDNVRVGSLLHEFPAVVQQLAISIPEVSHPWDTKICVNFGAVQTSEQILENPQVRILIPRIEAGRSHIATSVIQGADLRKTLFENASEKIGSSFVLYGTIPLNGFDTPAHARQRFEAVRHLMAITKTKQAVALLAAPENCDEVL